MVDINLIDPPGIQTQSKSLVHQSSSPKIQENIEKAEDSVSDIKVEKENQDSSNKYLFKYFIVIFISILIIVSGLYFYRNYISSSNKLTQLDSKAQSKSKSSLRSSRKKLESNQEKQTTISNPSFLPTKYSQTINSNQKYIFITSSFVSTLPTSALIKTIQCSKNELSGIVYFTTKKKGMTFKKELKNKLPNINPLVFSLEAGSHKNFSWKLVSLLDFSNFDRSLGSQKIVHKNDQQLSAIINQLTNNFNLTLGRFAISSPHQAQIRKYQITGQGDNKGINNFLQTLNQKNINLGIGKISIDKLKNTTEKCKFTITGKIYPKK